MAHLPTGGARDASFILKKPCPNRYKQLTDLWGSKTWGGVVGP